MPRCNIWRLIVVSILATAILTSWTNARPTERGEKDRWLIRVELIDHLSELPRLESMGMILASEAGVRWADFLATQDQVSALESAGFEVNILASPAEIEAARLPLDPEYHSYEEMVAELESLATIYPGIAAFDSIGTTTQLGWTIWAMKVSDNVELDEDEPVVLYIGVHHACEVMGLEASMFLINELLGDYHSNPQVMDWIDNTEIWFVPLMNPDGHFAVTDSISLYWRKNARDINNNQILFEYVCNNWWTCPTEGIDLNRNYDFNWIYGGSSEPWDYDFRGASPFSESENQALRDLAQAIRPSLSISYHSYGELVFYPWDLNGPAPDDGAISDIAQQMAIRMERLYSTSHYTWEPNSGWSGMSGNWYYGELGCFDFMVETLPYPYFIIPGEDLYEAYSKIRPGIVYLLDRVRGTSITGQIADYYTGDPLEATVSVLEVYGPEVTPRTSEPLYGRYRWLLTPGTYTLEVTKSGYETQTIDNIIVTEGNPATVDVALVPTIPPVTVSLTPDTIPIVIPPGGGSFGFVATLTNHTTDTVSIEAWADVELPNGNPYGPVVGPVTVTLLPGQTRQPHLTQAVPAYAPPGEYTYFGRIGNHPGFVLDEDSFAFTKQMP